MRLQKLFATRQAELFRFGVGGFRQAVGVEQEAIAGMQREFQRRIHGFGKHPEEQAILFDGADVTARTAAEEKRWVPRAGVAHDFAVEIGVEISGGDKVLFKLSAQRFIQAGQDAFGMPGVRFLSGESDLEHGSDDGGGHAVAGNVGNQNAELVVAEHQEIVKIAGHRAHGQITRGDLRARENRHGAGQNRGLDLARDGQLAVDGQQAVLVGKRAVSGHIPEAGDEEQEAEGFGVRSVPQAEAGKVALKHKSAKNEQAEVEDAQFRGPRRRQTAQPRNQPANQQPAYDDEYEIVVDGTREVSADTEQIRGNGRHGENRLDNQGQAQKSLGVRSEDLTEKQQKWDHQDKSDPVIDVALQRIGDAGERANDRQM